MFVLLQFFLDDFAQGTGSLAYHLLAVLFPAGGTLIKFLHRLPIEPVYPGYICAILAVKFRRYLGKSLVHHMSYFEQAGGFLITKFTSAALA